MGEFDCGLVKGSLLDLEDSFWVFWVKIGIEKGRFGVVFIVVVVLFGFGGVVGVCVGEVLLRGFLDVWGGLGDG